MRDFKVTRAGMRILRLLSFGLPGMWRSGAGISKDARIWAGSLYPALACFEKAGWVETQWEPGDVPWPRKRIYRLTTYGREAIKARYGELAPLPPSLLWRVKVWLFMRGLLPVSALAS